MPNHVTNKLIIGSVSNTRIAEILEAIKGEEKGCVIDFNKIIPMPEALDVTDGGYGNVGVFILSGENNGTYRTDKELQSQFDEMSDEDKKETLTLGQAYIDNLNNFGHKTWYSWRNEYWNTKWNSYDGSVTGNEIQFDTAWATPYGIIEKIAQMFPDVEFSLTYADEDLGYNCGRYTFLNGVETEYYQPKGGTDEAIELAVEVKGLQGEYIKNESTGEWDYASEFEEQEAHDDLTAEIENQAEAEANEG